MEKVPIIPKQLFELRNSSDIFDREIIAGVLRILNKKIVYQQIWDETTNKIENITVPFFYNFGGNNPNSEKFIQDNYLFFGSNECTDIGLKKIDGNFDIYPRGEISITSSQIDSGNITNRFVMGQFSRKENNQLKSYVGQLYSIPLDFQFSAEIKCQTMTEALKIKQAYIEYFYKNKTFHINYKGTIVPARIGFPEQLTIKAIENYTMGGTDQQQYVSVPFTLAVESYQPVFDPTTEMAIENNIQGFGLGVGIEGHTAKEGERKIYSLNDLSNKTLSSNTDILIEWGYSFQYADMLNISLSYIDNSTGEEYKIDDVENNNFYFWTIPNELNCIGDVDLIIPNTSELQVYKQPKIKIIPDLSTKIISPSSISILNKGYFITNLDVINAYISYVKKNGELEEIPVTINLLNNMINENNPTEFSKFVYKNEINAYNIDIIVADSYHPETNFKMTNISII